MTSNPPPYGESKPLYPSAQVDPQQQQPGVYYTPQGANPSAPGMTSVTYYPQGPQQPQAQQLVISQPPPVVVQQQPPPSLVCHIVLSCVTTFCCFCPCGFLAFILAGKTVVRVWLLPGTTPTKPSGITHFAS